MNETDIKVDEALAAMGVSFSVRYIGETVHYRVKIGAYETDFHQGLGLRGPAPKPTDGGPPPRPGTIMHAHLEAKRKPAAPTAASVLYRLLRDASAADQCFADWASEYGYDTDSRKALAIYEACCEIGRALRRVFTAAQRDELRELLQDY